MAQEKSVCVCVCVCVRKEKKTNEVKYESCEWNMGSYIILSTSLLTGVNC